MSFPRPRAGLLGLLLCAAGCQASRATSVALAPSILPNIGLAASAAVPLSSSGVWHAEARFTYQFLDDKAVADNGDPPAGDWTQLDLGFLRWSAPAEAHHWLLRFGLVGFEARGEPNLVEEAGRYLGLYCGVGRFLDLGQGFSLGPELTLLAASGNDPRVLFPQITWGLRWSPGRRARESERALPSP